MDSTTNAPAYSPILGPLRRSPTIGKIAAALATAQGQIKNALKDSSNPHFKSRYADLASAREAYSGPLAANGIALVQSPSAEGTKVTITTLLAHSSGEWIEGDLTMTAGQNSPQGIGSAITYARRYAAMAVTGVAPDDDDGEAAEGRSTNSQPAPANQPANSGTNSLKAKAGVSPEQKEALLAKVMADLKMDRDDAVSWIRLTRGERASQPWIPQDVKIIEAAIALAANPKQGTNGAEAA